MGYSAYLQECCFEMKENDIQQAYEHAKDFLMKHDQKIAGVEKQDIEDCYSLYALFEIFGFETMHKCQHYMDSDSMDIVSLDFFLEETGEEIILLKAIAPYVKDGSYLIWVGEDEEDILLRHLFKNGTVEESVYNSDDYF